MTGAHVREHSLCFRVTHDGLAAHGLKPIDLANIPTTRLCIGTGAALVVLGALAFHLVFGRDPDPDANRLGFATVGLALSCPPW